MASSEIVELTAPRQARLAAWSLRDACLVVHRYVGLALAVFLVVAGLTGTLIAFYPELDAALNPELFRARPSGSARRLTPLELRERLQSQLPSGSVDYVPLRRETDESQVLFVSHDSADPRSATLDDQYFLDPDTGAILGSRRLEDLTQGRRSVMPFVYRLHYSLALGEVGAYLFGGVALLWTLDCFVGAYLTFPARMPRGSHGPPPAAPWSRGSAWLRAWRRSWLIRARRSFALVFTWHRASGLWLWGLLLVFAWSAVALNLSEVYTPVMRTLFGMRSDEAIRKLPSPRTQPRLGWQAAHERARAALQQRAEKDGFRIIEEHALSYQAERGVYRYRVQSSLDVHERYPRTQVFLDGDSGAVLAFHAATGGATGDTLTTWLYALHFADVGALGVSYRAFVSGVGVAIAVLSGTGVWIWLRKRRKRLNAS